MKKWLLAGGGIVVAAAAVTLWWQRSGPDSSHAQSDKGAAHAAPFVAPRAKRRVQQGAPTIEALLKQDSAEAWKQIVSRYPAGSEETKRAVVQRIGRLKNLGQALEYLLATVGDDPVPPSEDRMIAEAAEVLKGRFKNAEDLQTGRRTMLLQKTDKRKWVVANALITAAKDIRENSPLAEEKTRLEAKLVDLHTTVSDGFVKSSIVDGMHSLGGSDAALILAKGPSVSDDELEAVRTEKATVQEVLERTNQH